MRIFVKTTDAISANGLPALVENISASTISGKNAQEIIENIGKILGDNDEYVREARVGFLSEDLVNLEKIFMIFEQEKINDSAPYYRIWQDEWCEGESFEIYCKPGSKLKIVKLPAEKP